MKLLPTKRYKRIYDIPIEVLKQLNIRLVLADMDNTLAPWHSDSVAQESVAWVKKVQSENITVGLLTNSKGSNADNIGRKLNIPVFKNAKKPFKSQTKRLLKELGFLSNETLIVGDQLFTDILLANKIKAKSVLVEPLSPNEWWATKVFNRTRERLVWKFLFK